MNKFPPCPWKENRQGAVSLCYLGLEAEALETVLAHHAAVGIRASLVCDTVRPDSSVPAERNWDLMAGSPDPDLLRSLHHLDGRSDRGCFFSGQAHPDSTGCLYQLSTQEDVIKAPAPDLTMPLPSFPAPADVPRVLDWIEAVVQKGHWLILRIDATCVSDMGTDQHRRLLQRLGDHHARIWCAPIRDIALFQP